jgi:phosphotransferase system HPr (HPr) family protein
VPTSSEALVQLPASVDLHARPAAEFVRTAMRFDARILVSNGAQQANAKSLLAILALGAKAGTTLRLEADGPEAAGALEGLAACVAGLA